MASFEELVTKLLTDPAFAKEFYNKDTRAKALDKIGINSGYPGLLAALDKIDYAAISNVRQIMDPVMNNKN
jgi:hypothetical protein